MVIHPRFNQSQEQNPSILFPSYDVMYNVNMLKCCSHAVIKVLHSLFLARSLGQEDRRAISGWRSQTKCKQLGKVFWRRYLSSKGLSLVHQEYSQSTSHHPYECGWIRTLSISGLSRAPTPGNMVAGEFQLLFSQWKFLALPISRKILKVWLEFNSCSKASASQLQRVEGRDRCHSWGQKKDLGTSFCLSGKEGKE